MAEHHDLVLERVLDVSHDRVWRAWTDPEQLKKWLAPRPYQTAECELDLRPGGVFYTRMTGSDGFDSPGTGCFLEIIEAERITWTTALLPGFRPAEDPADCGGFPFTATITFEETKDGRTLYRAVAMHRRASERDDHERLGFHEGWGTVAGQLEQIARDGDYRD